MSKVNTKTSRARLSISPLRTLSHEAAAVSPNLVTTRVNDAAAGRKTQILESLGGVPKASPREVMMNHQLSRVEVVRQLLADLTVSPPTGVHRSGCLL